MPRLSKNPPPLPRFDDLSSAGFVRLSALIPKVVPFSASTLWREVRAGRFPSPVKLAGRTTAWRVADIRAWLDAQGGK